MATTLLLPKERQDWYLDGDYVWTTHKHRLETINYSIDWADVLASGETISSAVWNSTGLTVSGEAVSGTETSANVTDTDGDIELKITTSASKIHVRVLRFRSVAEGGRRTRDYP